MDYLNNLINYIIKELPGIVGNWFVQQYLKFVWWLIHLPFWFKSLVMAILIITCILIIIAVIKNKDSWRHVY